jgi:hypothetical protein
MLHAYCDESYSGDLKTTPVYVVAGFVANAEQWQLFELLWLEDMRLLNIENIGCHASKCATGAGPYRHMNAKRRKDIQHRLIVDIVAAKLYGVVAIVEMAAYHKHKGDLFALFPKHERQYYKPHVRAVEQCVQQMCRATEKVTTEPIAFVVDQNVGNGSVKGSFRIARNHRANPWRDRLGSFTEDSRMRAVGLQAADMLAYAAFRFANGKRGWQWEALRSAISANVMKSGEKYWGNLVRDMYAARQAAIEAQSASRETL